MKRLIQLSLVIIIGLLVVASPVFAISVANAVYIADIVAQNSGTATTNVATVVPINTQAHIDGKYVTADLLNTALQTPGGTDVRYMPGVGSNPWVFWVPSIGANEQKSYMFYAGGPAMQTGHYYFPASGGMTTPDDDADLELGNNFTIEQKGRVDTSAGSGKNLVYKEGAFKTYVSAAECITSTSSNPGGDFPIVAAVNSGNYTVNSTSHIVNLPSDIASGNLLLVFFASDGNPTITFPSGWIQLFQTASETAVKFGAWYRIADGTEGATIDYVTTSVAEMTAYTSYRITGYYGIPEVASILTGTSNDPNPPSLTPSWGAANTLWFALLGYDNGTVTVSSYPANYTNEQNERANNTAGCGIGAARRNLNAATEDPGSFVLSASEEWVITTLAIRPGTVKTAAVTGVSSGELIVKTTADGTNMTLSVTNYAGTHQGNSPQSVDITGVSVINNSNDWSFCTNGSVSYLEYQKITISGTLTQHIVYERDTVFHDLTEYNNDATPTFITTSSDPDVTATLQNFRPIKEAKATIALTEETPEMLTETSEMPPEFYTEGSVNHLPGAELVNNLLDAGGIPQDLFWIPFCFGLAAVAAVLSYGFLRSMLFIAIIGAAIILFFGLTGAIPLWTFYIYVVIAGGVLVSERVFGW